MWPLEREVLGVWADELQARGDRLGQLIATSMRAEHLRREGIELELARSLDDRAERLRLELAPHMLGPAIGELPSLRLRWQLGVVRGLHLDRIAAAPPGAPPVRSKLVLEIVTKLLQRPALRFLDDLTLAAVGPDHGFERELLRELARPECLAQPRRIVLGATPRQFRRLVAGAQSSPPLADLPDDLLAGVCARNVTWLMRWGRIQTLPWSPGDHGSRLQQLDRLLARPAPHGQAPVVARAISRAIWDTSLRVRRRALAVLPELGDEAAPATLAALAVNLDGQRSFGDVVERSLTRIASSRPSWVEAVAENFSADEPWVAVWLGQTGRQTRASARVALPRIAGMLDRLAREGGPGHRMHHLRRARAQLRDPLRDPLREPLREPGAIEPLPSPDGETIAELLTKI